MDISLAAKPNSRHEPGMRSGSGRPKIWIGSLWKIPGRVAHEERNRRSDQPTGKNTWKNVWEKKLVTKTQSKKPKFHTGMVWKMQNSTKNPEAPAPKYFKNKRES